MTEGRRPTLAEAPDEFIQTKLARLADRDDYSRAELVAELDRRAANRDRAAAAERDGRLFWIGVASAVAAVAAAVAALISAMAAIARPE